MSHAPVDTALSWNSATKHSKLQPSLTKEAVLTNILHPHQSNNSKQHTYFNTHQ